MKKTIVAAALTVLLISPCLFAHAAKKEVKKNDTMVKLEKDVRELILEKGNYDSALKLYASAARKYTSQPYYKQQYSILRRVIKMKKAMKSEFERSSVFTEQQKKKWTSYYLAVRGYYYSHGYYSELLPLDRDACEILKTDQAKINYLETLVLLDKTNEAQKFSSETTGPIREKAKFKILDLIVQSRKGMPETVIESLGKIKIDPKEDARSLVYLACIYQLQKNHKKVCEYISKALENTAPTQISITRKLIENMKELKECSDSRKFQAALKTQSKVYQSGCTGGSSCNSCSLKGKCPSTK